MPVVALRYEPEGMSVVALIYEPKVYRLRPIYLH